MIPRLLHFIWLGSKPLPDEAAEIRDRWLGLHPAWGLQVWSDADVDRAREEGSLPMPDAVWELYDGHENPGHRSDILRLALLHRFGGVYADLDMWPQRPLDGLLGGLSAFAGTQDTRPSSFWIESAILGSVPGHRYFAQALEGLPTWFEAHRDCDIIDRTGPGYLSALHGRLRADSWTQAESLCVFEPRYFYPAPHTRAQEAREGFFASAYAVHRWSGAWVGQ